MAYSGTTAASSLQNPPVPVMARLNRGSSAGVALPNTRGGCLWFYASSDGSTVTSAANYFTDAKALGMLSGDIINGSYQSSAGSTDVHAYRLIVASVSTSGAICSTAQLSTA